MNNEPAHVPRTDPLIDPHRGDFADDASSTYQRSLWSLAGNVLVEISLPKLALSWLLVLVLPSLLLGLAPIVATAWFGTVREKYLYSLTAIVPALLFVAAIVVGWFGWRPLLRLATESFWALNSLAVEPLYLIVRESLRYLAERLLPAGASQQRYDRGRALSAAAAGLLICCLALAAIWLAWPASRWVGTLADLQAPLQTAKNAWINSVVLVSAYLAVAALGWGLADAAMPQPHDMSEFEPATPRSSKPDNHARMWRIAHLSDLHVVGEPYGFRLESGRLGPRGNERLALVWRRLEELHAADPLDFVLVTGDMTDAGRTSEWAAFLDSLAPHPRLAERVLILPGNHDLNVADRANPARLELPISPDRRLRQLRLLSAMHTLHGGRSRVIDHRAGRLGPTLSEVLQSQRPAIERFADAGRPLFSRKLLELWTDVFPLVVPPATEDGLGVVLLNSNIDSQFSFTSALGMISSEQVRGIEIAARQYSAARWLIALHHHVVEYPRAGHALAHRIGIALINGNWFVRRLRPLAARAVVIHGHRHIDWIGRCGELTIVSGPSPVMEATDEQPTCFYIHTLVAGDDPRLRLLRPERIVVQP
jgi:hypothetical protein